MGEGNRSRRIWKLILIVLALIILGVGGYFGWRFYQKNQDAKKESERIQKETDDLKNKTSQDSSKKSDESNKAKESKDTATSTACSTGLSDADKTAMANWKNYENSAHNYSFKNPGYSVIQDSADDVILFNEYGKTYLYFKAGSATDVEVNDTFIKSSEKTLTVGCQNAKEEFYKTSDNKEYIIRVSFTKDSTPYLVMLTYNNVGNSASLTGAITDDFELILKSVEFK